MPRKLDQTKWYTAAGAAPYLQVGVETVKRYLRGESDRVRLSGKQVGSKQRWMVHGAEIARARKALQLDLQ